MHNAVWRSRSLWPSEQSRCLFPHAYPWAGWGARFHRYGSFDQALYQRAIIQMLIQQATQSLLSDGLLQWNLNMNDSILLRPPKVAELLHLLLRLDAKGREESQFSAVTFLCECHSSGLKNPFILKIGTDQMLYCNLCHCWVWLLSLFNKLMFVFSCKDFLSSTLGYSMSILSV